MSSARAGDSDGDGAADSTSIKTLADLSSGVRAPPEGVREHGQVINLKCDERLIQKGAGELDQSFLTLRPDEAVAKVFDPIKSARDTLDRLARVLEPMGQLAQFADVFEPIRRFQEELADVAAAFEPIKGFHGHLENLANRFEPMRAFQSQLEGVAE